ncbi:hypothetical protein [Caballeronia sp. 15711]|uniref:hypothetical protein n=1 Tax=Caballeronia sp. 15711 TaxID=3391029 RepID=UPI0039E70E38
MKSTACAENRLLYGIFCISAKIGRHENRMLPGYGAAVIEKTNFPHAPVSQKSNDSALPDLFEKRRRSGETHEIPSE